MLSGYDEEFAYTELSVVFLLIFVLNKIRGFRLYKVDLEFYFNRIIDGEEGFISNLFFNNSSTKSQKNIILDYNPTLIIKVPTTFVELCRKNSITTSGAQYACGLRSIYFGLGYDTNKLDLTYQKEFMGYHNSEEVGEDKLFYMSHNLGMNLIILQPSNGLIICSFRKGLRKIALTINEGNHFTFSNTNTINQELLFLLESALINYYRDFMILEIKRNNNTGESKTMLTYGKDLDQVISKSSTDTSILGPVGFVSFADALKGMTTIRKEPENMESQIIEDIIESITKLIIEEILDDSVEELEWETSRIVLKKEIFLRDLRIYHNCKITHTRPPKHLLLSTLSKNTDEGIFIDKLKYDTEYEINTIKSYQKGIEYTKEKEKTIDILNKLFQRTISNPPSISDRLKSIEIDIEELKFSDEPLSFFEDELPPLSILVSSPPEVSSLPQLNSPPMLEVDSSLVSSPTKIEPNIEIELEQPEMMTQIPDVKNKKIRTPTTGSEVYTYKKRNKEEIKEFRYEPLDFSIVRLQLLLATMLGCPLSSIRDSCNSFSARDISSTLHAVSRSFDVQIVLRVFKESEYTKLIFNDSNVIIKVIRLCIFYVNDIPKFLCIYNTIYEERISVTALDFLDEDESRLPKIISGYEDYKLMFIANSIKVKKPKSVSLIAGARNYPSYADYVGQMIHNLMVMRHNTCVKCLCLQNEFTKELPEAEMEFLDLNYNDGETDENYEITFSRTGMYKMRKGIEASKILLLNPIKCVKQEFFPFKINDESIGSINSISTLINQIKEDYSIKFGDLKVASNYEYTIPDVKLMKNIDIIEPVSIKHTEAELEAYDTCVKHFKKMKDDCIDTGKFVSVVNNFKLMSPYKITKAIVDSMKIFRSFEQMKPKCSFHVPPLEDYSRSSIVNWDMIDAIKDDTWLNGLNKLTMKCNTHLGFAKIDYVKIKKTLKESEIPKYKSVSYDSSLKDLDDFIRYMHQSSSKHYRSSIKVLSTKSLGNKLMNEELAIQNSYVDFVHSLKMSQYMRFISDVFTCLLHHCEKTTKNDIIVDCASYSNFVIFIGHGSNIINRKMSRPFCVLTRSPNLELNSLFPIDKITEFGDHLLTLTKWMRLPLSYIEHFSSIYEKYMISTIIPCLHDESGTLEERILEDSKLKGIILLNNKKGLQLFLDNIKYLTMGSLSVFSNVDKLILDKLSEPIKDLVELKFIRLLHERLPLIFNSMIMPRKPTSTGTVRNDSSRGGQFSIPCLFKDRNATNMYTLMDNFYLSHLTTKDAQTGYHDINAAFKGIIEWEVYYNNFMDQEFEQCSSLDYLKKLLERNTNKIQFHPLIISYGIKSMMQKCKTVNKLKEELERFRLDMSISEIANTRSMVESKIDVPNEEERGLNAYNVKNKSFEMRSKVHDIVVSYMSSGKVTIGDFLQEMIDNVPYFNIKDKIQFGSGREIYIQDMVTRLSNFVIERVYSIIAKHLPEESISKKGDEKIIFMSGICDKTSMTEGLTVHENRDCSKWSLGSTLEEFEVMTMAFSSILGRDLSSLTMKFFQNMKNKELEIPHSVWKIWSRDYFDPTKLNKEMAEVYNRSKDTLTLKFKNNWLMGMFNYASSVKGVSKMYFVKDILHDIKFDIPFHHMEHSDDEYISYTLSRDIISEMGSYINCIKLVDEVVEFAHMTHNTRTNEKKSNIQLILAEMVSSFNFNGQYCDPPINFYSAIFQPTNHDGWSNDMEQYVGRCREYCRRSGYISDLPILIHYVKSKMNNMYRFGPSHHNDVSNIFGLEQESIPVSLGGIPNCDPLGLYYGGISFHNLALANAQNPKINFMLNKLLRLTHDTEDFYGFGNMKFIYSFKKYKLNDKLTNLIPKEKESIPKTKSSTLEFRRLCHDYADPSFLKAYSESSYVSNIIKLATFVKSDVVINDVGALNSNSEHSIWREKRGHMTLKCCTIKDYLNMFVGEDKHYDTNKDYLKYDLILSQIAFFLRNVQTKKVEKNTNFTYRKIQTTPHLINIQNSLNTMLLYKYKPELFKILNDEAPETIDRNNLLKDLNEFNRFAFKLTYEDAFKMVDNISRKTAIYRCDNYSANLLDAFTSSLTSYWSSNRHYYAICEKQFKYVNPVTNEMIIQIEHSKFSTDLASKILYCLNLYTFSILTSGDFNLYASNLKLDLDRMCGYSHKDLVDSGLNAVNIRNWGLLKYNYSGNMDILTECFKTGIYSHMWLENTKKVRKLVAFFRDSKAELSERGNIMNLKLDISNTNHLHKLLYYIEGVFGLRILDMNKIESVDSYKSVFCRNAVDGDKIYYRDRMQYSQTVSEVGLKCEFGHISNFQIPSESDKELVVINNKVLVGTTTLFNYNHKFETTAFNVIETDLKYMGVRITTLINNDAILAIKNNRYIDLKLTQEELEILFEGQDMESKVENIFLELTTQTKIYDLFIDDHKEAISFKQKNPELYNKIIGVRSSSFESKPPKLSKEEEDYVKRYEDIRDKRLAEIKSHQEHMLTNSEIFLQSENNLKTLLNIHISSLNREISIEERKEINELILKCNNDLSNCRGESNVNAEYAKRKNDEYEIEIKNLTKKDWIDYLISESNKNLFSKLENKSGFFDDVSDFSLDSDGEEKPKANKDVANLTKKDEGFFDDISSLNITDIGDNESNKSNTEDKRSNKSNKDKSDIEDRESHSSKGDKESDTDMIMIKKEDPLGSGKSSIKSKKEDPPGYFDDISSLGLTSIGESESSNNSYKSAMSNVLIPKMEEVEGVEIKEYIPERMEINMSKLLTDDQEDFVRKLKVTNLEIYTKPMSLDAMFMFYKEGITNPFQMYSEEIVLTVSKEVRTLNEFLARSLENELTPKLRGYDIADWRVMFREVWNYFKFKGEKKDIRQLFKIKAFTEYMITITIPDYMTTEEPLKENEINDLFGIVRPQLKIEPILKPRNRWGLGGSKRK
jgi:hypothetical protein